MTIVLITLIASTLAGWLVLQLRIGSDREAARAHELALARQASDDRLNKTAETLAMTRLAEVNAINSNTRWGDDKRLLDVYIREHYRSAYREVELAAEARTKEIPS